MSSGGFTFIVILRLRAMHKLTFASLLCVIAIIYITLPQSQSFRLEETCSLIDTVVSTPITLFEIFILSPKIQFWFPEKNCLIVLGENSWKCCSFGLFSCWQLSFHVKNCQKKFGWKLVKMLGFCGLYQNWIFGQKFDFSNSVEKTLIFF